MLGGDREPLQFGLGQLGVLAQPFHVRVLDALLLVHVGDVGARLADHALHEFQVVLLGPGNRVQLGLHHVQLMVQVVQREAELLF